MFSKACEYAIRSAICIAQKRLNNQRVNVKEISASIDAPVAFIAKILQQLCKANIIESVRGHQGGFSIDIERLKEIKIYDIIVAIDGSGLFTKCGLGLKECSSVNPCPVHNDFREIKAKLENITKSYSLYDLALKTEQGLAWLKI
ncbi:Rrf2 family transcriptional regulator [Riemerella anatipestifer]|uniref:Rrf2 family transcriptional regulator n=1 Tax=Riemerella anatipestifer TaxID=34085 RepID=A0AAP3EWP5_RIEAN|nr:Rrf2 family transcriptional regulator [Riemerella anatipestifer]MBT0571912.1 Rrf2 family transcriptional regulator [Riemerella anatipestifer]MCU7568680.1 Rrf2 family transcriptional regulator [Riemerella anatipestifer]MCW0488981.1 Rrf2 family transcriptional regulator [Riemerella anatipestifer]MCW0524199.1 Rrf2 family transcriptional regulator [Riemerella anatipestifer]MDR7797140.1 Rrf2 family transcriptional regulator [Riemerella anatipestifer]